MKFPLLLLLLSPVILPAEDALKITSVEINGAEITVHVDYVLESVDECDLMVGANIEKHGGYLMSNDTVRLKKGSDKTSITYRCGKWEISEGERIYVNLSPTVRDGTAGWKTLTDNSYRIHDLLATAAANADAAESLKPLPRESAKPAKDSPGVNDF